MFSFQMEDTPYENIPHSSEENRTRYRQDMIGFNYMFEIKLDLFDAINLWKEKLTCKKGIDMSGINVNIIVVEFL